MNGFSFNAIWPRASPRKWAGARRIVVAIGLLLVASMAPSYAQAPPLGTLVNFGVLAGSTVTNTGPSVIGTGAIPANVGVSPGAAIVGLAVSPAATPGTVHGVINAADATALQAQVDLTAAYLNLLSRPATVNLTGQNLGGLTLVPGVYNFDSSAQLTGALTLNGLGNPNAVFIFKIGSSLTTASASVVSLINGAQGGNVFWQVGSSATLGTTTSFAGDILAQASITLNTAADIGCGAAWARVGAVTLDTNTITLCTITVGTSSIVLGPTGAPLFVSLLPSSADNSQLAVANAIDNYVSNGGTLPLAFANLYNLSSADLAIAFSQLQGEAGTGSAQAGTQAMDSFLSLLTNPFSNSRSFAEDRRPVQSPRSMPVKARRYASGGGQSPAASAFASAEGAPFMGAHRWGVWGAAYGGQSDTTGDVSAGSHDRSVRTFGVAAGLDYLITPSTVVGFALAGGGTSFGLAGGFGSGRSDMFQAAVYSSTRINAAYLSAAVAYAWHHVSTDRYVTVAGTDHLTADYFGNNIGGRIEGGYRYAIPGVFDSPGFGVTPYAALQVQAFYTPSYSETAVSGSSTFALAYDARTTTTARSELGVWVDQTYSLDHDSAFSLFGRVAWAHDWYSDPSVIATFLSLPGSSFTEFGAPPAHDSVLLTAGAQLFMRNGWSVMAKLDSELSRDSQSYVGTGRIRYTW